MTKVSGGVERGERILVVDDDTLVAEVLAGCLENKWGSQTTVISDAGMALRVVRDSGPYDLILVDFRMPGDAELPLVERLVRLNRPHPVVVVSGKIGPQAVRAVISIGAKGFISKRISVRQMLRRLEVVLNGETYIPPEMIASDTTEGLLPAGVNITTRERQVLRGIRDGLTNKEIARDLDLSDITVKLHVRSILKKFGLSNRTQLAMLESGEPAAVSLGEPRSVRSASVTQRN